MAKKLATARQIHDELNRRMATAQGLPEFYRKLRVSMPRQASPADRGCNWHVDNLQASVATEGPIPQHVVDESGRIVGEMEAEYDCSDW